MKSFWLSVGSVSAGTILGHGVYLLSLPIITRLAQPGDFGSYAEILSFALILASLLFLGLERAIPTITGNIRRVITGVLILFAMVAVVISTALVLLAYYFQLVTDLVFYVYVIFLGFAIALANLLSYCLVAEERFNAEAGLRVGLPLALAVSQLLSVKYVYHQGALALADIVAKLVVCIYSFAKFGLIRRGDLRPFKLREYSSFYKFGLPSTLAITTSMSLPFILVANRYGVADAGFFFLASKLTTAPVSLFGGAVGKVYFARAAKAQSAPDLKRLFRKTVVVLTYCSVLVVSLLLLGSLFVDVIFGSTWSGVSSYIFSLLPLVFIQFITNPVSMTLTVLRKQHLDLYFSVARLLCVVVSLYVLPLYGLSVQESVVTYALMTAFVYMFSSLVSYRAI